MVVCMQESLLHMEKLSCKQMSESVGEIRLLTESRCDMLGREIQNMKVELRNEVEQVTIPMVSSFGEV